MKVLYSISLIIGVIVLDEENAKKKYSIILLKIFLANLFSLICSAHIHRQV